MCNAQCSHTVGSDVQLHTNSALSRFHCSSYANAPHRTLPTLPEGANLPRRLQLITAPPDHYLGVTPMTDAASLAPNLWTDQLHAQADFIPWKMTPDIH